VFTSTRQVTSLAMADGGEVWVGTSGGLLRGRPDGAWEKFTRLDGLPAHEARQIRVEPEGVTAVFASARAAWRAGDWCVESPPRRLEDVELVEGQTSAATWRGAPIAATLTGLRWREGGSWREVALPASSRGTHISALLPRGPELWAGLFGDGLWAFDGDGWQPVRTGLPARACEITALAGAGETLWLGTRREGLWEHAGAAWRQRLQPDEPYDHNCQALTMYRGQLFASTLEDGLAVKTEEGWRHLGGGVLSSDAPRQMVEFAGMLYLRHGSGKLDRCAGGRWSRNVLSWLPRRQVSALAADGRRLYVAQWGGWSEFDGRAWTHFLKVPGLQGLPITTLFPDGGRLWIGTQGKGLAEFTRTTGALRWHDERHGLPDDWVTSVARAGDALYAGTYAGGPARWMGKRWAQVPELARQNVTAVVPDAAGGVFVATRGGLWQYGPDGAVASLQPRAPFLDREVQALCAVREGLWVGTRTGLYFLSNGTLRSREKAEPR
jgi:ligand-binding sensor domain-containing protein